MASPWSLARRLAPLLLCVGLDAGAVEPGLDPQHQWGTWRGPLATGVAPHADPPVTWSEAEGVRWRAPVPGSGHGTPVVWGDRIFLTTAIPYGDRVPPTGEHAHGEHDNAEVTHAMEFVVLAIERTTGELLWQKTVHRELPREAGHRSGSMASASPATDGVHLVTFFGSHGLFVLDLDGTVLWNEDLGQMATKHAHGEGASPTLHGDTVVVNWDHEGESFVVAYDKWSGEERWRRARAEKTSWSTPIVVEHGGVGQVVVSATGRIRSYELATGRLLWECGGLSDNVVASPVYADGVLYAGSSYVTRAMLAIRLDGASGDLTGTLYSLKHYQGLLYRLDPATGAERQPPMRLDGVYNVYASPVSAAGRVYITDLDGTTAVLDEAAPSRVLARNRLPDRFAASAAVVGDVIYLRGEHTLWALGAPAAP